MRAARTCWLMLPLLLWGAACSLDEAPLPGTVATGDAGGDGDADADADGDGDGDGDADADGGTGCTVDVSAPAEVTLGARVTVRSGLACADDPATHTCSWRAEWNDDSDDVDPLASGDHPCVAGETYLFAAAAVSDDASSFYRVTLSVDGEVTPGRGRAHVFVGRFEMVAGTKNSLKKVADIAIDAATRRAWIASEEGLAAMLGFTGPAEAVVMGGANECADAAERCTQHTVAVAGGFAWAGSGADLAQIVRAEIIDRALVADAIPIATKGRVRSIVASRVAGGDSDPGLYVSQDALTWVVTNDDLDSGSLNVEDELGTDGDDLGAIIATDVEPSEGGDEEALWRLESGARGEVQRLEALGGDPVALTSEEVLDRNASSIAVFQRLVVLGQSDGRAFAVDLDSLDPDADTPLVDASGVLELPIVDDPDATLDTIDDVLDLFVSADGLTLWAVSTDTLYRVTGGTLFASSIADLPAAMRAIAVLSDGGGAEVILVGTDDGIYLSRADLHD